MTLVLVVALAGRLVTTQLSLAEIPGPQTKMSGDGRPRGQSPVGQGCKTERSTLKPSNLASVKVNRWKVAVGQGVKGPSPGISGPNRVNPYRGSSSRHKELLNVV